MEPAFRTRATAVTGCCRHAYRPSRSSAVPRARLLLFLSPPGSATQRASSQVDFSRERLVRCLPGEPPSLCACIHSGVRALCSVRSHEARLTAHVRASWAVHAPETHLRRAILSYVWAACRRNWSRTRFRRKAPNSCQPRLSAPHAAGDWHGLRAGSIFAHRQRRYRTTARAINLLLLLSIP